MTILSIFIFLTNCFLYSITFAITPTEMLYKASKKQLQHKDRKNILKKTKKEMLRDDKKIIRNIVISLSTVAFFFICIQYYKSVLNYLHAYIKSIFAQEYATLEQNVQQFKNLYSEQQKKSDATLENLKKGYEKEQQEKTKEINKLKQKTNILTNGMVQVTQNINEHRNAITNLDNSMKTINPDHISTLHKTPLLEFCTHFLKSFFTGKNITIVGTFGLLIGTGCYFWEKISKFWLIKYPLKGLKAIKQLVSSKKLSEEDVENIAAKLVKAEVEITNQKLVLIENKVNRCSMDILEGNNKVEDVNKIMKEMNDNSTNRQNVIEEKSNHLTKQVNGIHQKIDQNNLKTQENIACKIEQLKNNINQGIVTKYDSISQQNSKIRDNQDLMNQTLLDLTNEIGNVKTLANNYKYLELKYNAVVEFNNSLSDRIKILEEEKTKSQRDQINFLQQPIVIDQPNNNNHQNTSNIEQNSSNINNPNLKKSENNKKQNGKKTKKKTDKPFLISTLNAWSNQCNIVPINYEQNNELTDIIHATDKSNSQEDGLLKIIIDSNITNPTQSD